MPRNIRNACAGNDRSEITKNQYAAIPFGPFFFWFVHNSFAMLIIAQWLSKNHAQSLPQQGTSMIMPSILTAAPNFIGQFFWDGIQENWLQSNEFSLQTSRFPPIILYTQATNTRIITNDFGTVTAPIGITQKKRSAPFPCEILFVGSIWSKNRIGVQSNRC